MISLLDLTQLLRTRVVGMLEAYIDESASSRRDERPRIFVVAGWCGDRDAWRELEYPWSVVLGDLGLDEFHSSDCLGGYRAYAGMSKEKRDSLRSQLISTIVCSRLRGAISVVVLDRTVGAVNPGQEYHLCMKDCMLALASDSSTGPEMVAFVIDEQTKHAQDINAARMALRDGPSGYRIGPAAFDRSKDRIGLQAADLLAHESYLQRRSEIAGSPEPRREFQILSGRATMRRLRWNSGEIDLAPLTAARPSLISRLFGNLRFGNRD